MVGSDEEEEEDDDDDDDDEEEGAADVENKRQTLCAWEGKKEREMREWRKGGVSNAYLYVKCMRGGGGGEWGVGVPFHFQFHLRSLVLRRRHHQALLRHLPPPN